MVANHQLALDAGQKVSQCNKLILKHRVKEEYKHQLRIYIALNITIKNLSKNKCIKGPDKHLLK